MPSLQCTYCALEIADDSYLHCAQCGGDVHVKCLKHSSTPGDLLGDVFFDFMCAKCVSKAQPSDRPSTSSESNGSGAREKFVRQRMPWLLVISLALYNLSIKSKGLSRHGYFHWRTHIVNFIDKHWDYLFDPSVKRRKKWTGSISGALSHNSPKYFTSGQELFEETGWWKLTHANKTPKYIFGIYEQQCLQRQQMRMDKRQLEESYASDTSNSEQANKRAKPNEAEEEPPNKYLCSRMIPYMGRKPKVAKQLDVLDDDNLLNLVPSMPLNTVQSSLMDFLAESLASDDLTMFNNLDPLVESPGKNDMMPLLDPPNDNAHFYDSASSNLIKTESMDLNGHLYNDANSQVLLSEKLKGLYASEGKSSKEQAHHGRKPNHHAAKVGMGKNWIDDNDLSSENSASAHVEYSNSVEVHTTPSTRNEEALQLSNDGSENESDAEDFQPRIVQVTNFQQMSADEREKVQHCSPLKKGKVKRERISECDVSGKHNKEHNEEENEESESSSSDEDINDIQSLLKDCKPSLFTKQPKRQWPWLVEESNASEEELKQLVDAAGTDHEIPNQGELSTMSEYEEKVLLQKLSRIVAMETKCNISIPSTIRRFYRKLCTREWKRKHGKPLFNLDEMVKSKHLGHNERDSAKIIDRYQLIASAAKDSRRTFYARIAGSFHCEFFESPYTQRVLHPYIFRNRKSFPPYLKLMCELQFKVNGIYPERAPVDFCYVRPNHIAAVNSLLQNEFWPGIDMSECLSYPDYSVVAMYKKLVVGCGFLVPDVGYNEAYISFMAVRPGWQRAGIGTFMLYHLIQTCMTKDITLHVSATNPAVVLYQKFGFKMEEVILNFYDKYLPFESKHSRHALFLRLMR